MTDSYVKPDMRDALRRHVLNEHVRAPCVDGSQREDVRVFRMAEPGTRMMSVDLIFAAGRIFISGDLRVTDHHGLVSGIGYGVDWFVATGPCDESYLAEKFLRKRHVPALAVAGVRDAAARFFEDRHIDGEEPTEEEREQKAALEEAAARGEGGPCASSHELYELYDGLEIDVSDGVPGWGYDPREVGWLAAVQQRFAELYAAGGSTSIRQEPGTFEASAGRSGG